MEKKITMPLTKEKVQDLKAGDMVLISGVIYTARDAAHKRLIELLKVKKELPLDVKDSIIYYVGPSPAKPGNAIGSAGPTTSYRMDPYAPSLLDLGLKGMIGKGLRSKEVIESMKRIGDNMPACLKETSKEGLAITKTAENIKNKLDKIV